jgi:hypothetical protein
LAPHWPIFLTALSKPARTRDAKELVIFKPVLSSQEQPTMESLTKREHPDRSKINVHQPDELKYWVRALDVTREELLIAIDKVGNSATAVRRELERMASRQDSNTKKQEFIEKAAECAREARHQAALLPEGPIRDALLEKAKNYDSSVPEDKSYQ